MPIGTIIVPAVNADGVSQTLGPIFDSDLLSFTVSGTPDLRDGNGKANAAGVGLSVGPAGEPAGGANLNKEEDLGFTFGALIATLNGVSRQVFAPSRENGLGSATPPTRFTYTGSVASLFGAGVTGLCLRRRRSPVAVGRG